MSAFKRISVSDAFVVPYTANKSWEIPSSSFNAENIVFNIGTKGTGDFNPDIEYITNGQYDRLVYATINSTYYPTFLPKTISTFSKGGTFYYEDLSTASYNNGFVDLGNINTYKYFPTGTNATIYTLSIPTELAGAKILPTTFEMAISGGKIYDDGNYNLLYSGSNQSSTIGTTLSASSYVGNIFYEQNIAILTVIPGSVRPTGWRGINAYCEVLPTPTPTLTPTATPIEGVTFSRAFTQSVAPTTTIETAWNTFRASLTGTYTQFVWSSTNGNTLTVSHPTLVQTLANGLRTATVTAVTINSVSWRVGTGCGTPKIGGVAVEFSNIGSCNASSTYALRPMINNANWGGTNQSTVNAPSQTITLTFS